MMRDTIKYSFIVPIYNVKDYLAQCIDSILSQEGSNFELVLIDDGSTDGSDKICNQYIHDSRVVIKHTKNNGVSIARNIGISNAHGEYIINVDADDYIHKSFLKFLKNSNEDFIAYDAVEVDSEGNEKTIIPYDENLKGINRIKTSYIFYACKKKVYIENHILFPEKTYHEDDAVMYKLLFFSKSTKHIKQPLYYYRAKRRSSTMNNKTNKMIDDLYLVTSNNIDFFRKRVGKEEYSEFILNICVGKMFDYLIYKAIYSRDIKDIIDYKNKVLNKLNDSGVDWNESLYFKSSNYLLNIFRKAIKYNTFIYIVYLPFIRKVLAKRM